VLLSSGRLTAQPNVSKTKKKIMNLPKKHFLETQKLSLALSRDILSNWLLNYGYYPENYVLPPCFSINSFTLLTEPYFTISKNKYDPLLDQPITISFPKSLLTVRTYGIINPKIYHDLTHLITNNWKAVNEILFSEDLKIYSYSFPIPVIKNKLNNLSDLRSGRLIYEFLEMAENDLVSEAYKYRYLIKSDISNFYPSIYTHSLSWAIHTKEEIRKPGNRHNYTYFGNCIDKLVQNANDGCTNGLSIGSALSDLISEILLTSIDVKSSKMLTEQEIDFIAVRFKDDYRILCKSKEDASNILHVLQQNLLEANLVLNEKKTFICDLPEGLYREWTSEYKKVSIKQKGRFPFKIFEETLLAVLEIDKAIPGTGVIDRFLSDITTKEGKLRVLFTKKEKRKFISLLLLLKTRRPKVFPKILALMEQLYISTKEVDLQDFIKEIVNDLLVQKIKSQEDDEYEIIWLLYFRKKVLDIDEILPPFKNPFIESVNQNKQLFFQDFSDAPLFTDIYDIKKTIYHYLKIFK
jgi:hypothetical protein